MSKKVFINLQEGDFEKGFQVVLRILDDANGTVREIHQNSGVLPPSVNLEQLFCQWQTDFHNKVKQQSRGKAGKIIKSSSSRSAEYLTTYINDWLNSGNTEWRKIRDALQQNLNRDDEIQVIIQTKHTLLRQLPWQVWDLFVDSYPNTEIGFSSINVHTIVPAQKHSKVKILAVLGKSNKIKINFDKKLLTELQKQDAEIKFLNKPTKKELLDSLWDESGWQIFFFAGHSESRNGEIGWIYLKNNERLEMSELKNSLKISIKRGLVLAIFNSCDGLGLANQLAELDLPLSVVMREPIPDKVAQDFLQYFLQEFAKGSSCYVSMRRARGRLEDEWDKQYPGVGWLPVIFQNPTVEPAIWNKLYDNNVESNNVTLINQTVGEEPDFDPILAKKSPDLFTQLQKIRIKVIPDLKKIPSDVYCLNSVDHARAVLSLVYTLYSPVLESSFNANELFVLGVLCLVHDVGMMPRNDFDNEKVFNSHCQYSYEYVISMVNNKLLEKDIGEKIARLCFIHNKRIGVARSKLKNLESPELRLVLIYAMFKIADMLEVEQQPGAILRTIAPNVITNNIGEFDIDSESQILTFYPTPEADPKYFDMLVKAFSDYFKEAEKEFNMIGLNYKVIAKP
jgi:hypothetical protein